MLHRDTSAADYVNLPILGNYFTVLFWQTSRLRDCKSRRPSSTALSPAGIEPWPLQELESIEHHIRRALKCVTGGMRTTSHLSSKASNIWRERLVSCMDIRHPDHGILIAQGRIKSHAGGVGARFSCGFSYRFSRGISHDSTPPSVRITERRDGWSHGRHRP